MRINIIDPKLLADQHLIAEYREIKMLPKALIKSINSKNGLDLSRISKEYTLNKGHGYFFYNKISYITNRFNLLLDEMHNRDFQTNFTSLELDNIPPYLFNDYTPSPDEIRTNIERLLLRIDDKPLWYKYYNLNINFHQLYLPLTVE